MKLNKQQINALASKFYNELKEDYNKVNNVFKEEQLKKFKPDYEKGVRLMKNNSFLESIEINISDKYSVKLERNDNFDDYISKYNFKNVIKNIERKIPSIETIINDIILATIDSTSVDEIMKNLKQKYK
jgi:hypothetical protein